MQLVINRNTFKVIFSYFFYSPLNLINYFFNIWIGVLRIRVIFDIASFDDILVALAPPLLLDVTRILCDPLLALLYPRLQLLQMLDPVCDLIDLDQFRDHLARLVLDSDALYQHVYLLLLCVFWFIWLFCWWRLLHCDVKLGESSVWKDQRRVLWVQTHLLSVHVYLPQFLLLKGFLKFF